VGHTSDEDGGSGLEEPVAEFVEGRPVEAGHGAGPRPRHTTARDVVGDMGVAGGGVGCDGIFSFCAK